MVTKGYISNIIDKYKVNVRCPIYDKLKASSLNNEPTEFTICSQTGVYENVSVGDTVFVSFENNDIGNGVILGYLVQDVEQKSHVGLQLLSISVDNSIKLPKQTSIGDITWFDISNLSGIKSNISEQIESAYATNDDIHRYIKSVQDKINSNEKEAKSLLEKLNSQKKTVETFISLIGNSDDETEKTLFGRLNSYNKIIDSVNKSMGQFSNETVISDEIDRLNKICEELYNGIVDTTPTPVPGYITPYGIMLGRAEKMISVQWKAKSTFSMWNSNNSFIEGKTYTGMPYTLWSFGYTYDSWKKNSDSNTTYSGYASGYGKRSGPKYGSCCADFVSEVLALPVHSRNCTGIKAQTDYLDTLTGNDAKAYNIKVGDVLWCSAHVMWVGKVEGDNLTVYEQTSPLAHRINLSVSKDSKNGYIVRGERTYDTLLRPTEKLLLLPKNQSSDTTPSIKNNWVYKGNKKYGAYSEQSLTETEYFNNALIFWKLCKQAGWTAEACAGAWSNTYAESTGNPWSYGTGGGGIFGFTPFDFGTRYSTGIYDYAQDVLGNSEKRWDGDTQVGYVNWQIKNVIENHWTSIFCIREPKSRWWYYEPPSDTKIPKDDFGIDTYIKLDKKHYGATPTICAKLWLSRYGVVDKTYPGRDLNRTIENHIKKAEELYNLFIKY